MFYGPVTQPSLPRPANVLWNTRRSPRLHRQLRQAVMALHPEGRAALRGDRLARLVLQLLPVRGRLRFGASTRRLRQIDLGAGLGQAAHVPARLIDAAVPPPTRCGPKRVTANDGAGRADRGA